MSDLERWKSSKSPKSEVRLLFAAFENTLWQSPKPETSLRAVRAKGPRVSFRSKLATREVKFPRDPMFRKRKESSNAPFPEHDRKVTRPPRERERERERLALRHHSQTPTQGSQCCRSSVNGRITILPLDAGLRAEERALQVFVAPAPDVQSRSYPLSFSPKQLSRGFLSILWLRYLGSDPLRSFQVPNESKGSVRRVP